MLFWTFFFINLKYEYNFKNIRVQIYHVKFFSKIYKLCTVSVLINMKTRKSR